MVLMRSSPLLKTRVCWRVDARELLNDLLAQPCGNGFAYDNQADDGQQDGGYCTPVQRINGALQDDAYAAGSHQAQYCRFAQVYIPPQYADCKKGGYDLRDDGIQNDFGARGARRFQCLYRPAVDLFDCLAQKLAQEAQRSEHNGNDACQHAWTENGHKQERPDQRVDRAARNQYEAAQP